MSNPLVSICIPTYNGERFLDECIQSCIGQTFRDYEIVICDDGSVDATARIIESYVQKSPLIRFIKNPVNLGLVGNWNKCIQESKGTWIKFVFQDDFISPDCLQEFMNAAADDVKLMVSERDFILPADASGDVKNYYANVVRTLKNTGSYSSNNYSDKLISKIAVQNIAMNFIGEPSLSFFRKTIIVEIGLFNPALKQICDFEFLLRAGSRYGLKYIPKKLCSFRIHANTTTNANVASNYFVLHYIEPLLFSYLLLHDPKFKWFRRNISYPQYLKLRLYFKVKAHKAYKANKSGGHEHYLFREDYPDYFEVRKEAKGNLFVWLITAILR